MKLSPVHTEFKITSSRSTSENVLVGLYAFFLNTKVIDKHLLDLDGKIKFVSSNVADMGAEIFKYNENEIRKLVYSKFLYFLNENPLATFLIEENYIMANFKNAFDKNNARPQPFIHMTGYRFRDLTGYDRKRMPKDLKKSFEKKAQTSLTKFVEEFEEKRQNIFGDKGVPISKSEWVKRTLDVDRNDYIPYESLRSIHNNLVKYSKQGEDMTDSIKRVRDMWDVISVMES